MSNTKKQSSRGVLLKRCSQKFHKIHRETPVPATLLKKRLWHRCFPVNFMKFLRTPFLQNTSGGCSLTQFSHTEIFEVYHALCNKQILKVHQCRYENLPISSSSHENNMPKVSHYNTVNFLRYTHPRYMKCLFTNIQKQQNVKKQPTF